MPLSSYWNNYSNTSGIYLNPLSERLSHSQSRHFCDPSRWFVPVLIDDRQSLECINVGKSNWSFPRPAGQKTHQYPFCYAVLMSAYKKFRETEVQLCVKRVFHNTIVELAFIRIRRQYLLQVLVDLYSINNASNMTDLSYMRWRFLTIRIAIIIWLVQNVSD